MTKNNAHVVLAAAILAPILLFLLLFLRLHLPAAVAAAVAILSGWAANVGWAKSSEQLVSPPPASAKHSTTVIAQRFGWLCPAILVAAAWAALRFIWGYTP
ncbi:hypothetical protein [Lysobacter xanthus]